jgi:hypothetical protein
MPVPRCPACGGEAADLSEQEMDEAAQSVEKSRAELMVCHCVESHRFVVSLEERGPVEALLWLPRVSRHSV